MNTTISQASVWGDAWQTDSFQAPTKPLTNQEIRESYNVKINEAYEQKFVQIAKKYHDNDQCFGEEDAREAFAMRNEIKEAHQAETSWVGQIAIRLRNLVMYGAGNATYESLSRKKNPEEIAYSAFKTDGSDLGLAGNGFGDILNTWNAIKEVSTIYPESITPAMVAAFKAQPAGKIDPAAILAARGDVEKNDESQVQKLVEQAMSTKASSTKHVELFSKDELIASLAHAPRRSYSYM